MKHKQKSLSSNTTEPEEHNTVQTQDVQELEQSNSDQCESIPLEPGMTAVCFVPKYADEEPQIGSIISILPESDEVVIEWMSGTYSELWTVCKKRKKGGYTTWKENIPRLMVLFPIELSQSSCISGVLKKKLQLAYDKVRN